MTNQFNIKTTQKKLLQVTEETVVQLSNLDLGAILREKFNLPDAEILWDVQSGLPVCKIRSVKNTEEVQELKDGEADQVDQVNPDDPSTWKVGDLIECLDSRISPTGTIEEVVEIDEYSIYRTDNRNKYDIRCFGRGTVNRLWKWHSRPTK